ncbi:hypothetical protein QWZ14_22680 [Paeniroseomonas aquatica]|uniref:Uncharacterized protein n=1 Tax=Paeniroseomonas aquatica TaxID=373043 RepID=A0ABT8ABU1_9PROT|nr:hypothetical protein [Paeniroseomonas aquatica]MDN3567195.1 hypothetical protein [Paeniroseomonas aquatica]
MQAMLGSAAWEWSACKASPGGGVSPGGIAADGAEDGRQRRAAAVEQRALQRRQPPGEARPGAGLRLLAAEQQHGMVEEGVVQHLERRGIDRAGEVEAGDLGGEAGLDVHGRGSRQGRAAGLGGRRLSADSLPAGAGRLSSAPLPSANPGLPPPGAGALISHRSMVGLRQNIR